MQSNMVSPFSVHQQQLAMLAQQQSLLMAAAAANASGGASKVPGSTQTGLNGANLPNQNWSNVGLQFPGIMTPAAGKIELDKYSQMGNMGTTHFVGNSFALPISSSYTVGSNASSDGILPSVAGKQSVPSISSGTPQSSEKEYDFSSLTQGFFTKH